MVIQSTARRFLQFLSGSLHTCRHLKKDFLGNMDPYNFIGNIDAHISLPGETSRFYKLSPILPCRNIHGSAMHLSCRYSVCS